MAPLEATEPAEAAGLTGERIAQCGVEDRDDARREEERPGVVIDGVGDLRGEVVGEMAGVARESAELRAEIDLVDEKVVIRSLGRRTLTDSSTEEVEKDAVDDAGVSDPAEDADAGD